MTNTSVGEGAFTIETEYAAMSKSFYSAYEISWGEKDKDSSLKRVCCERFNLRYVYSKKSLHIWTHTPHVRIATFEDNTQHRYKLGIADMNDMMARIYIELEKLKQVEKTVVSDVYD